MDNNKSMEKADCSGHSEIVKLLSVGSHETKIVGAEQKYKKDPPFLYFATITANLTIWVCGCSFVWTSPVIPKLRSNDSNLNPLEAPITSLEESWIAALLRLGYAIGPLMSWKLIDLCGRKQILTYLASIQLLCYVVLAFVRHIVMYYIVRFTIGTTVGVLFAVVPMYVGEISEVNNRGKFGCFREIFLGLGVLYALSIGSCTSYTVFNLAIAIPPILFLISFPKFLPESPVYLAMRGDRMGALEAIMRLRNKSRTDAENDLLDIIETLDKLSGEKESSKTLFTSTPLRKGLIRCTGLTVLPHFSGITSVITYLGPIFEQSGSTWSPNICAIFVALIRLPAVMLPSLLIDKAGRRPLLMISTIAMSVFVTILGTYFYLKNVGYASIGNLRWLPVTSLTLLIISFNLASGAIPWVIMGEIFPAHVKSLACSLTSFLSGIEGFVVIFLFPLVAENFGIATCFFTFGVFCACEALYVYLKIPETKGKTLLEIHSMLGQ